MEIDDNLFSSSITTESMEGPDSTSEEFHDCSVRLRMNPERRKEKVYIGCGAGFGGDRPLAAFKLLQRVEELDYIVLECLAERTLAERYQAMKSGGKGYDPRISEWMQLLLPAALEKGICIITNMGACDPYGAREEVIKTATKLGISINVGVAHQFAIDDEGLDDHLKNIDGAASVYLGAAPLVQCLEKYKPNVVITSRVADAALFLAPMVYELGWNWDEYQLLAQGTLAGHLLECGCQLTGGYYVHPGDKQRDISPEKLLDLSLPFAEVWFDGRVCVAKAEGSGGVLNSSTCAQQLLYEVGDPSAYITPDVVIDLREVSFQQLSNDQVLCFGAKPSAEPLPDKLLLLATKDKGWKGWGEISYGGCKCIERAATAEFLVRSWMEETFPSTKNHIVSYIIGLDSLHVMCKTNRMIQTSEDIRLRMDGLFEEEKHAIQLTKEFTALYTNGPAGGGGISTGYKKEIILEKGLIGRQYITWHISAARNGTKGSSDLIPRRKDVEKTSMSHGLDSRLLSAEYQELLASTGFPAPSGRDIPLYDVAHSRAGDKGNDLNFSIIPYFPPDINRLKLVITPEWVKAAVSELLDQSSFPDLDSIARRNSWIAENVKVEIYEARGIHSLNVVVRNILDGGVNCSRRIDRHGKSISDLILSQLVILPP
ncbi:OLC1v1039195C1 [Oldenlandia corymbosa var. corymbosa]|uniref:OLC1v1039195C1 n=1 Tax=Oldenlandia corymbosa var. corymbosa TaxID=529605 RepID=A0AAV1D2H1_OLDCO|nr:OLC1v1039195C1 [Oldenlandia corymbosa var. corymbosa]